MDKDYVRVFMLMPVKFETIQMLEVILLTLSCRFDGATYAEKNISIIMEVMGIWIDNTIRALRRDKHVLIIVDVDITKHLNYVKYFSNFKHEYEKKLKEKELWITFQPIKRVV
jgi:hypothetical protein